MAKLYPPVIEGTIPAFNGAVLTVPFSMNRSVSAAQIQGFAVKIKTVQSSTWITTLTNGIFNKETMTATFELGDEWEPTPGQYYKLQLAYINNSETGYFSTVGVVKYTTINNSCIKLRAKGTNLVSLSATYPFVYTYEATYNYNDDPMEKIYNYRFVIYTSGDEVAYSSGWLLHNAANDSSINTSIDAYTFIEDLEEGEIYYLQYEAITVNGLLLNTPRYKITMPEEMVSPYPMTLLAENNYDNGYIALTPFGENYDVNEPSAEITVSGQFCIYRCNVLTPKRWDPVCRFLLQQQQPSSFTWKDFTVEHGETYRYKLCQFNDADIVALSAYSNDVYVDFEDMFLFDGERQLKIQYNPKVSSFKNDILESKLDTIGSKYPFFFRNGHVNYKEFPISGLISYWVDNEELFKPLKEMYLETENLTRDGEAFEPIYQVKDTHEFVRYRHWIVDSVKDKETGQEIDTSHWSSWGAWTDNGLIWLIPGYPHTGGEYSDASHEHSQRHEKQFETRSTGKWLNTNKEWIKGHNIPADSYRTINSAAPLLDSKTPAWDDNKIGAGTEYAYNKHYKTKNLLNYNLAAEKKFKLDVLEWLTNGKPKLFRSPAEGNYIVRLMNTSLTPNDTVGRMLHTFNCTAYEIDDINYSNLKNYGFISTELSAEDTIRLRFRTLDLQSLYKNIDKNLYTLIDGDDGAYIELLIDPHTGEKVTAQSVLIEDCEYGDVFKIDNKDIMIGVTQSYNLDNLHPIHSIKFYPSKVAAFGRTVDPFADVDAAPHVTYSYYGGFTGISLFDMIEGIEYQTVPARQFIRANLNTDVYDINGALIQKPNVDIISQIEDIKTTVTKYYEVQFEKRPVETIYSAVTWEYLQSYVNELTNEFIEANFTFDKTGLMKGREDIIHFLSETPFYLYHVEPMSIYDFKEHESAYASESGVLSGYSIQYVLIDRVRLENDEEYRNRFISDSGLLMPVRQYYTLQNDKYVQYLGETMPASGDLYARMLLDHDDNEFPNRLYYVDNRYVDNPAGYFVPVQNLREEDYVAGKYYIQDPENNFNYILANDAFDNDVMYYEKLPDYYLQYNNGRFVVFEGDDRFNTKVYMNTPDDDKLKDSTRQDLDNLRFNTTSGAWQPDIDGAVIDVGDSVQPVLYHNLDKINNLYIGNGILATLSYQVAIVTYSFENEPEIAGWKYRYQYYLNNLQKSRAEYIGGADPDFTAVTFASINPRPNNKYNSYFNQDRIAGAKTRIQWVLDSYQDFITKLNERIDEWKGENDIDD